MTEAVHFEDAHKIAIVINTRTVYTSHKHLNYDQVIELAELDPTLRYTVSYRYPDGREGPLVKGGGSVEVEEGMIFDVDRTTES